MASKDEDDRPDTEPSDSDDDREQSSEDQDDEQNDEQETEKDASADSEDAEKEEPAAKKEPAVKSKPSSKEGAKAAGKSKKGVHPAGKRPVASAGVKGARKPGQTAKPKPSGSMVKSMILFLIIVGGLAAAFLLLSPPEGGPVPAPKWNNGQVVDVEITLVASDSRDLACASAEAVAGRKCEFETQSKPNPKVEGEDADKKLLKPYTTTDRVQFLAAGIWSEPALKAKLPTTRFSVKCKYTVEGKIKKPGIRWSTEWYEPGSDWYAGVVSACSLVP